MRNDAFWEWFDDYAAPRLIGRDRTFRLMFEHLDRVDNAPLIVETGCIESPDNWRGNGCSTILFDMYCQTRKDARAFSVDINRDHVDIARACVRKVKVTQNDSVRYLKSFAERPHLARKVSLLYLDGSHLHWAHPVPAQLHHLNELMAIMPALSPYSLVVVDDTPITIDSAPQVEFGGKGGFVARYAQDIGANLEFTEWQTGWTNMTAELPVFANTSREWTLDTRERLDDLVNQARTFVEADNLVAANALYKTIFTITTNVELTGRQRVARGEACAFFARISAKVGKYGTAVDWYNAALSSDPLATDYRLELALRALRPMNARVSALTEAKRATAISPDEPRAWHVRGGLEHELAYTEDCIASYDKQLEIAPDDPDAMLDRLSIGLDVGDYKRVRELALKVLATDRAADGWNALGAVEYRERNYQASIDAFRKAIAGNCYDTAMAHWNLSVSLHAIGRYKEAWIEHEYRDKNKTNPVLSIPLLRFNLPVWKGEAAPALIHVHDEAGAGDVIAMARYLPMMLERGYKVRFEVREEMMSLMRDSLPQEIEIVQKAKDYPGAIGIDKFDYHCPVGRLPMIFETDIDTVPAEVPYIKADPVLVRKYSAQLPFGRKVGLAWSSGIREGIWMGHYGRNKSMAVKTLLPLIGPTASAFVSLQVGDGRNELEPGLAYDLLPAEPTWADTAALIECLDLVITVDTAVAHLAGAMGKPTWLMMHTQGSWHWMDPPADSPWFTRSPWYPTVRIFRAKRLGEWGPVVSAIAAELANTLVEAAE